MDSLSQEQKDAFTAIQRGENIFLTGPGGTGKSYIISLLRSRFPDKQIAITAMTGCAALLIGNNAKTLHSWAGIGLGKGTVPSHVSTIRKIAPLAKRWRSVDLLVIDEVSMLTPDLLDLLNEIGKQIRKSSRPMGGIQVVFVGDFLQLPPVAKGGIAHFAFETPSWTEIITKKIHLKRIFRQEDVTFQKILDEARFGELSPASLEVLKSRSNLTWSSDEKVAIQPTMLFTRKLDVEAINKEKLDQLEGTAYSFSAKTLPVSGHSAAEITKTVDKMDKDASYVPELLLKVGAQVMLLTNVEAERGLVNGSRGVVTGFKEDKAHWPIVLFKNGEHTVVSPHIWKSEHDAPIERQQIPLRLAYALTIHKAQGATLDCALIDVGSSTFEYGQAYVALSRVKSLDSLYVHEVSSGAFRAHPTVRKFYSGTYEAPQPLISDEKLTLAGYAFADEEEEAPLKEKQASLTSYFGVPAPRKTSTDAKKPAKL